MNLKEKINAIYALQSDELDLLLNTAERFTFPKNHLLITTERVEKYIYFIEKGIARAYCNTEKQQLTFWFGLAGDIVFSFNSYINEKPGYENIDLLEDSILWRFPHQTLQELFTKHVGLANWGRKLAELELVKTEERFINQQFKTATERYQDLLKNSPSLLQNVQLTYIASYLGVTPVTLSRIRAEIK
ncbi:MAG: Crp/Fnr family transcriptional regulator [Chitinophagaceae bacterium]|nr:MAG: Crp/Fnr family transcriptional regulator [Chitinophagaceae bacterium]